MNGLKQLKVIQIISWIVFAITTFFACYSVFLPSEYFIFDKVGEHRSDYVIGWFWIMCFGAVSAIVMLILTVGQRRAAGFYIKLIWVTPVFILMLSAFFFVYTQ